LIRLLAQILLQVHHRGRRFQLLRFGLLGRFCWRTLFIERTLQDLKLQGKADSTIACYRSDLNKCGAALTTIDLDFTDLTKKNLTRLLEIVQTNQAGLQLSPGRLSGVFSALSSLMEFLEFNDEIVSNPVPSFRKRYLTPYKRQGGLELPRFCPTTEQVRTVVSLAPDSRDKAIHILFAKTGLRKKELRALDVDDINLVEKYVMAKPSAKRTGRKLPLDDECCLYHLVQTHILLAKMSKAMIQKNKRILFIR